MSVADQIAKIVRPNLKFASTDGPIDHSDSLGELGLDSLGSIEVLSQLEAHFEIYIPDESIDENTFDSIESLTGLIDPLIEKN